MANREEIEREGQNGKLFFFEDQTFRPNQGGVGMCTFIGCTWVVVVGVAAVGGVLGYLASCGKKHGSKIED